MTSRSVVFLWVFAYSLLTNCPSTESRCCTCLRMVLMKISLRIERQFGIESVHGTLREVPATAFNSLPVQGMLCGLKAFFFSDPAGQVSAAGLELSCHN